MFLYWTQITDRMTKVAIKTRLKQFEGGKKRSMAKQSHKQLVCKF